MHTRLLPPLLAAAMFGCAVPVPIAPPVAPPADVPAASTTPAPAPPNNPPPIAPRPAAAGVVSGVVKAPAGIIAAGGLNYAVTAVEEKPLPGVKVVVADAAGKPLPGTPTAKTDAQGRFELRGLPEGQTFVVQAEVTTRAGKPAALQSLAKADAAGANAELGVASTLVTQAVVEQAGETLGAFNPSTFGAAVAAAARGLRSEQDVPDLADRRAVRAKVAQLLEQTAELKSLVGTLRSDIADLRATIDDLKARLDAKASPTPAPTASPTAAPTATPTSAPTPQPSASSEPSPSPAATVAPTPSPTPSPTPTPTASPTPAATPTPSPTPSPTPVAGKLYWLSGKVVSNTGYPVKVRFAAWTAKDPDGADAETTTDAAGNFRLQLRAGTDGDAYYYIYFTPPSGGEISRGTFRTYTDEQVLSAYYI